MTNCVDTTVVLSRIAEFYPDCSDIEYATLDSLHIDSFAMIEIILNIESEFDIEFEDEMLDPESFETMGHLAHYVAGRISLNGPG